MTIKIILSIIVGVILTPIPGEGNQLKKLFPYTTDFAKPPILPYREKQDSLNVSFVTRVLHGAPMATFVKDTLAYYSEGGMFIILNVKDVPTVVGKLNTPTIIKGIYVLENYAYLANWDFGLAIVDVANPTNPQEVGRYTDIKIAEKVFVKDSIAYVTDSWSGKLLLLNVKNPTTITKIGEWGTIGTNHPFDIYVRDSFAYITDRYYGIRIINCANPSFPTEIGSCALGSVVLNLHIKDNIAYVVCEYDNLIKVVNIAHPTAPTVIGECKISSIPWNIVIYDTFAYVGGKRMEGGYGKIEILNVAKPYSPFIIAEDTTTNEIYDMYVLGNKLYFTSFSQHPSPFLEGFCVLDLTKPTQPKRVGNYNTGGDAYDVTVDGNYLYVAHGSAGVKVLDITNPANPVEIATCTTMFTHQIDIVDTFLYAPAGSTLYIINITKPNSPKIVGKFIDTTMIIQDVDIQDTLAYILDIKNNQFIVINVANPNSPTQVGILPIEAQFLISVKVVGNFAYIIDFMRGLRVINVTNPASPQQIGTLNMQELPLGIDIYGRYGYVPTVQGGFKIIDISDPNSPKIVTTLKDDFHDGTVLVEDTLAILSGFVHGLQIIDVTPPNEPTRVGFYNLFLPNIQLFRGVAIKHDYIYLVDVSAGVWVFKSTLLPGIEEEKEEEKNTQIIDCFPNPFYSKTNILYYVSKEMPVSINVYDIAGNLIRTIVNEVKKEGRYKIVWDGKNNYGNRVPEGMYFIRMRIGDKEISHKIVFVE